HRALPSQATSNLSGRTNPTLLNHAELHHDDWLTGGLYRTLPSPTQPCQTGLDRATKSSAVF
ncbi:MAG: hypothetical protein OD918_00150, partial [Gammaproteobacteria bacterium]